MSARRWVSLGAGTGFILVIGSLRSPNAAPPDHWLATRDLAPNHQVERADLVGPVSRVRLSKLERADLLVGQHLVAAKRKGDSIGTADVSATAHYTPGPPRSRVAIYKLGPDDYLGLAIPQGTWVVPCYTRPGAKPPDSLTTRCSADSLFVEAVHRKVAPADDSWLALRIPFCHSSIIGEYLARDHHFLMAAPVPSPSR